MNAVPALTNVNACPVPRPNGSAVWLFGLAWVIVAFAAAGLTFVLQPIWTGRPDLADRFLIPLASAVLIYLAWPRLKAAQRHPNALGLIPLALGAAGFAAGWYLAVQVSGRTIIVWWLTSAFIVMTFGLTLTHFGWRHVAILSFPLLFILFSLPPPGVIYDPLKRGLQPFTTKAAEVTLPYLGIAVQRPDPTGFTLVLPSGKALGVVEECSGIRSVMALTAIAVLVAYIRGFGWIRGLILVGLTVGIVGISNAARIVATGMLQEYAGPKYIRDWYHDALGIGAVLVGLALIIGLSTLMVPRRRVKKVSDPKPTVASTHSDNSVGSGFAAVAILTVAVGACVWAEQFRLNHRAIVRLDEFSQKIGSWQGTDTEIDEVVKSTLMCDQLLQREYVNPLGQRIQVWVMFWANAATTADMHHPDVCVPNKGFVISAPPDVQPIPLSRNVEDLRVSVRHYSKPQSQVILHYWTQEGGQVLPDGQVYPQGLWGHEWVLRLLQSHKPIAQEARISVLIVAQARGSIAASEKLMREFTGLFAEELYRLCPWALPGKPSSN